MRPGKTGIKGPKTVAPNEMKTLLLLSSLLFGEIVFGQLSKDTTISRWTLDSLQSEVWHKSATLSRMKWAYQRKENLLKMDSIFIRQDSIVINHWSKENKLLYQESINLRKGSFKSGYCKGLIVKRFF